MNREKIGMRASATSIVVNIGFSVVKIVTGIFGNSYALVADGIESAGDVVASMVVWSGLRISSVPPDERHPYGHGKAESLAGFLAAMALGVSALVIAWNSIHEIRTPHSVPANYTLAVLVGIIVLKGIMWRFLSHTGKHLDSTSLRSEAWHHLSDAITSAAVMIGLIIALAGGEEYAHADDVAALIVCSFILYNAYHIMKPSLDEIMDASVAPQTIEKVRVESLKVLGVSGIDEIRIRKSGLGYLLDIHVEVTGSITVREGHDIAHQVKQHLMQWDAFNIVDVVVHIEPHERMGKRYKETAF